MSEVTLNLSDYKSSGVYFVEVDNSIVQGTAANAALRLAVGYNEQGPFNRPIYLSSTADCDELLGDIDRKLERKGCYTNRSIRTMVAKAPVYAINLLPVENSDKTSFNEISFNIGASNKSGEVEFKELFDRTKFWVADSDAMMRGIAQDSSYKDSSIGPLFAFGNCGTKDMSLIVRKAEDLKGYNVTFLDWYGSKDAIPYKWINPYDYVSDYFVQVVAVAGSYNNYEALAKDPLWKQYFNKTGVKREAFNRFLRLDAVKVIGNWTGCILPDFYNKRGICMSLEYQINKVCNKTGLMFGVNHDALDSIKLVIDASGARFCDGENVDDTSIKTPLLDVNGISVNKNSDELCNYMSYTSAGKKHNAVNIFTSFCGESECEFYIYKDALDASISSSTSFFEPAVGDLVRAADGTLARIIKKRISEKTGATGTDASTRTIISYTASAPINKNAGDTTYALSVSDDLNITNVEETLPETPDHQDYQVLGENTTGDSWTPGANANVEIHRAITNLYTSLNFLPLPGLKITNNHRPGYDTSGNLDVEAGVTKIYDMLKDSGIRKGLMNLEAIDFRYVVDTMAGGLGEGTGCKKALAELAQEKGSCTALINLPSMTDFANSNKTIFRDSSVSAFDVKYIPLGGNFDESTDSNAFQFTLPTEEDGAKFAAYFTPYLKYSEGVRTILVPPAADVCNTFINKYTGGDPYKTVANLNGILRNSAISGLEYDFDKEDRDALEPFGINPIISRNGNIMIYGDRTAYQTVDSDYNFLHVRELLNTIENRCRAILNDYVFTYNNAATRAEIASRLDPILRSMKDSGALAKYEMQIDELNNTKEVIDQKVCIVDIGVWVTPNMEKVVTRITVNRGSAA